MSIRWEGDLLANLRVAAAKAHRLDDDVYEGARLILADSDERVPKREGDLEGSGHLKRDRGGNNTVAIEYTSVYARWVHEHVNFHHPFGGEAKFLETALLMKGMDAVNKAGEHFWERL